MAEKVGVGENWMVDVSLAIGNEHTLCSQYQRRRAGARRASRAGIMAAAKAHQAAALRACQHQHISCRARIVWHNARDNRRISRRMVRRMSKLACAASLTLCDKRSNQDHALRSYGIGRDVGSCVLGASVDSVMGSTCAHLASPTRSNRGERRLGGAYRHQRSSAAATSVGRSTSAQGLSAAAPP